MYAAIWPKEHALSLQWKISSKQVTNVVIQNENLTFYDEPMFACTSKTLEASSFCMNVCLSDETDKTPGTRHNGTHLMWIPFQNYSSCYRHTEDIKHISTIASRLLSQCNIGYQFYDRRFEVLARNTSKEQLMCSREPSNVACRRVCFHRTQ